MMFYFIHTLLQKARNLHMLIVIIVIGLYKWGSSYGIGTWISQLITRDETDTWYVCMNWVTNSGALRRKGLIISFQSSCLCADVLRSHVSAIFWRSLLHSRGRTEVRGQIDWPICPCWSVISWLREPPVFTPRLQCASMSHLWCQKYQNQNDRRLNMFYCLGRGQYF